MFYQIVLSFGIFLLEYIMFKIDNFCESGHIYLNRIQASNLEELSDNFSNPENVLSDCLDLLDMESEAVVWLDLQSKGIMGYAVTVTVFLGNTSSSFTQLIMGTSKTAPEVSIQ